jgi:hypothetical protein
VALGASASARVKGGRGNQFPGFQSPKDSGTNIQDLLPVNDESYSTDISGASLQMPAQCACSDAFLEGLIYSYLHVFLLS